MASERFGPNDPGYGAGLRQLIADLSEREMQLLDFDEAGPDGISFITAPVFSPEGQVSLELTLSGLPCGLEHAELQNYVERLCAAAAFVTTEIHGRIPTSGTGRVEKISHAR
jgi:DNA-binding IclR family transcriptional regulator